MRTAWTAIAALLAAMAFAPAVASAQLEEGNIVVADPNAFDGDGGLISVDPSTGAQRALSNNSISGQNLFTDPNGLALEPDGTIVVADPGASGGSGGLIRVDPDTGQQTPLSSNAISPIHLFADPVNVVVAPSGRLMVADSSANGGTGAVIGVDPSTGQQSLVSNNLSSPTPLFASPFGIVLERNGTVLVADPDSPAPVSATSGAIIAVDPTTGVQKLITNNDTSQSALFGSPLGIALETPGTLLVANTSADPVQNGVILVSRFSGQQYGLATDAMFAAPTGISMDLDGKALVADREAFGGGGGVIRVEPSNGTKSTVSGNPNSADALFVDPSGLMVVPPTCFGAYATIAGTQGADALTGTAGPDVIAARGGDDIVDGKQGADLICGGEGRDRLIGGDGKDRFLGGEAGDVILGKNGADNAKGELGNDKIDGGRGNDRVYGQQRRDNLVGGKGRDLLKGGPAPGKDQQKQ
jgi:Ca2+-binding RTX toxin-like protein